MKNGTMKKLTETQVQNRIWSKYIGRSLIVVPCSEVFRWESDILVVTRALITHEFEIKLTRADFLSDRKKPKFWHIDQFRRWGHRFEQDIQQPPNYFWYVCPKDLIAIDEVPSYAGLAYVNDYALRVQKKPQRLHKEKLPLKDLIQICGFVNGRYWDFRTRDYRASKEELLNAYRAGFSDRTDWRGTLLNYADWKKSFMTYWKTEQGRRRA